MISGSGSGPSIQLRLSVLWLVIMSLVSVMVARLWYLQVMASPTYRLEAEGNRTRSVWELAPRGRILDRQGRPLVENRASTVITVNRSQATPKEREQVLARLSPLLNVPLVELEKRLANPRYTMYQPTPVAHDVPEETVLYIREHQEDFPGVAVSQIAQRFYPHGTLASHLLGYVGEIDADELAKRRSQGYRLGDDFGRSGVERTYEDILRGKAGIQRLEVDARGEVIRTLSSRPAEPGNDVVLTIDLDVQRLADEALAQGIQAAQRAYDSSTRKHFLAPAGSVVVMDPKDGSVLAMASYPTYDPSLFVGTVRQELIGALLDPAAHAPINNRALQGQYAPGSTFKLITSLAALKARLITPATTMNDTGVYTINQCRGTKCTFRNAQGRKYGSVSLARALSVSSDVFYYRLGATFWTEGPQVGIQDLARALGLGAPTGIPLPFEAEGRVADPETRKRLHRQAPDKFPNDRWYTGDNVNLAIGQGELAVTPLQLANAYASFANGGSVFAPRVASRFLSPAGKVVGEVRPRLLRQVEIGSTGRSAIMAGLAAAVTSKEGTAHGAFVGFPFNRLSVAGKTGTAEVRGKQDTALFVAMAPVEEPEYVVAVVLEEAGFGGQSAAPVARRILEGIAGTPADSLAPVRTTAGVD